MELPPCPWDAIERLEFACWDPHFPSLWRAFVAACGRRVLGRLPPEARAWSDAATGYARGELTAGEMATLSVTASEYARDRRGSDPWPVECGLLVVLTGFATGIDSDRWYEGAWHFLNCCEAAGLPAEELGRLLAENFDPLTPA